MPVCLVFAGTTQTVAEEQYVSAQVAKTFAVYFCKAKVEHTCKLYHAMLKHAGSFVPVSHRCIHATVTTHAVPSENATLPDCAAATGATAAPQPFLCQPSNSHPAPYH